MKDRHMDGSAHDDTPMTGPVRDGGAPADRAGRPDRVIVPLPPLTVDPWHVAELALPLARNVARRSGVPLTLVSVVEQAPSFNPLTRMAAPATPGSEEMP